MPIPGTLLGMEITQPKLLFIIDDNEDTLDVAVQTLSLEGRSSKSFRNYKSALLALHADEPSALIVDYRVSDADFTIETFILSVRALYPNMRIVICSGDPKAENFKVVGANALVQKPYNSDTLLKAID